MNDKKLIKILENKISKQKHKITQLEQTCKERDFLLTSKKKEALSDLCEVALNLADDLTMDKTGEVGYATAEEVIKAIKKYTYKILDRKISKWIKLTNKG